MAKKDWKKSARIEYETTDYTLAEIAHKYKKSESSVRLASSKEKWAKNKSKNCTEIKQEITQKKKEIIQKEVENLSEEIKEQVKEEITRTARQLYLAQLLGDKIENALKARFKTEFDKEGNALQVVFDIKDLKAIASSLTDLQKIERTAEGLDKPETIQDEKGGGVTDLMDVIEKSRKLYQ